jgi:hypothetical protein
MLSIAPQRCAFGTRYLNLSTSILIRGVDARQWGSLGEYYEDSKIPSKGEILSLCNFGVTANPQHHLMLVFGL